ncbi:MAG: FtsH-binding integral membrane protein, partial [Bacteroidia bacterium]
MNTEYNTLDQELLSSSTTEEKAAFYRKTYAHVAGAFLIFMVVEAILLSSDAVINLMMSMTQGYTWLIVLGLFMLATTQAEKMVARATSMPMQYVGFFIYILAEALIFVPLLYIAMSYTNGSNLLVQAFVVTLALFAGLSAVVIITKKDFSFMR